MLNTKDAIEKRRSIRKFKRNSVPEKHLMALIESARLAPSGCNAQPWCFKIVTDQESKDKLAEAAHEQMFIANAPVVIVCCADIKGYMDGTVSGIQDLGRIGAVENRIVKLLCTSMEEMKIMELEEFQPKIAFNVAIAIEHMVLRALDFGLGTCWIRLIDQDMIKRIFHWDDNIYVVALLPLGYPAEEPAPRKRLLPEDILLD